MEDTSSVRSIDKKTNIITKAEIQSEFVELDKTIEEKRLKLALNLRKF